MIQGVSQVMAADKAQFCLCGREIAWRRALEREAREAGFDLLGPDAFERALLPRDL